MEKYCRAGHARDDNINACTFHAGYLRLQTHRICDTYCFSTAKKTVVGIRLSACHVILIFMKPSIIKRFLIEIFGYHSN